MTSLAIIPARYGSQGLPDKNAMPVCGHPMVLHALAACQGAVDRVVVSTDSAEVRKVCQAFGAEVVDRPPDLAGDRIGVEEVARDLLCTLYPDGKMPDITIIVQPNLPIWEPGVIARLLDMMEKDDITGAGTAFYVDTHPQWFKRLTDEGFIAPVHQTMCITRQGFTKFIYFDGAAIAVRTNVLMNSAREDHYHLYWAGRRLVPHLRHPIYGMEVHDQQDLQVAETVLRGMAR